MNNLQHIVKDNTRFAMHMAVELCDQGDFDSVPEAFKWLSQETVGSYTRWHELFGTPERAARTLVDISERVNFDGIGGDYDTILGWLRGDV